MGSGLRQISSCTIFSRKEHSLFDAQDRSAYVLKPIRTGKHRQTKKPKHSASTACSFSRRTIWKEPRHKLLGRGARSPTGSRDGRSGSVSKGVCRPMGSLSKQSPRRWSLQGLIPVWLSVARRAYASAPKRKIKYRTEDLEACADSLRSCVRHAG